MITAVFLMGKINSHTSLNFTLLDGGLWRTSSGGSGRLLHFIGLKNPHSQLTGDEIKRFLSTACQSD